MKIIFYINTLGNGGAERVMSTLASYFAEQGNDVTLLNSFPVENEYVLNEKVRHEYIEEKKIEQNFIKRNASRIVKLRRIVKRESPDVIVSFMPEPNFRTAIACIGLKNKVVVSVRNDPKKENKNIVHKLISKFVIRKADAIVFQTQEAQDYFGRSIVNKSKIILNPIKSSIYNVEYAGQRKNIVTAGRLAEQKNQQMLIEAFSRISNITEENLLIYGEGSKYAELHKKIEELGLENRAFLMGRSNNLHEEIKSAKIFVLPSDFEGLPNALMEAMALGLPCISTDCPCGGPRMIIADGENGILIPVGDVGALEEKMRYLLRASDGERNALGKNARKTAEMFKADIVCKTWEQYIIHVIMKD